MVKILFPALAVVIIFFSLLESPAFAQTSGGTVSEGGILDLEYLRQQKNEFIIKNGNLRIRGLSVSGLERTHLSAFLDEARVPEGDLLSEFDPKEFISSINKMNMFTDIRLSYSNQDGLAEISVHLKEKWSFIPIPVVSSNNSGTYAGLYLIDMNFLGYNKKVFIGGLYSPKFFSGMFGYIDPSINGSRFHMESSLSYKSALIELENEEGVRQRKFKADLSSALFSFGYSISKKMSFDLKTGMNAGIVDTSYAKKMNDPSSQQNFQYGGVFKYDGRIYYDYFTYGLHLTLESRRHSGFSNIDASYSVHESKASYAVQIFEADRLTFSGCGFYSSAPDILMPAIGGKTGFFTVNPDVIISDRYASLTLTYEYPVYSMNSGSITVQAFWEQGMYHRSEGGYQKSFGPGVGMVFYLKRVAIPAIGLNIAKSIPTGEYMTSFSIGMHM